MVSDYQQQRAWVVRMEKGEECSGVPTGGPNLISAQKVVGDFAGKYE